MAQPNVKIRLTADDQTRAAFSSAQKNFKSIETDARRLQSTMASLGLSIGAAAGVRGLARMADEFSSLQARLKLASRDVKEFNAANADLVRISTAAQSPLSETATLYTRIAASVKDLDVSQSAIASTTEAVALSLKISGASAGEASSAMLQFSQAIASGVLRGEEFNAINEAAPRLLQALASSLKVPVGSLREMAKEGQLTRDVLINGLLSELPKLQEEAATLPRTIGAAFTDLNNKLLLTVGELNKVTGAVDGVNKAIGAIGGTGIDALAVAGANVAFVFKAIGIELGGFAAQIDALLSGDFVGRGRIYRMVEEDLKAARKDLDAFEQRILGVGQASSSPAATATNGARPSATVKSTAATKTLNLAALASADLARNMKMAADEQERFAGDAAFMADVNVSQSNAVNAIAQEWVEAGRAVTLEFQSPVEKAAIEVARLQTLLEKDLISPETFVRAKESIEIDLVQPLEKTKTLAEEIGLTFTSAFEDAVAGGEKFSDVLKALEQDLMKLLLRKSVTEPLMGAINGIDFGAIIGSIFANANGNVYSSPGLSAYSGSVVSKPTLFPFASGIGLMGEAGAEAILPLKRGTDGKLGVAGGGTSVQINVNNNAPGTRATATARDDGGVQMIDIMVEQVDGAFGRRIARGEGATAAAMERRYGLNPAAGAMR